MLTAKQVRRLYEDGVDICISRKLRKDREKGEYDPSRPAAIVYMKSIDSREDFCITLFHELIHARDDTQSSRYEGTKERKTEREARRTYSDNLGIVRFIARLYGGKIEKALDSFLE